jgi:hypothetical protein
MGMTEKRFKGGQWKVTVMGLDLIFKILLIIAEILLYQIFIPNGVCDTDWRNNLKERLEDLR